ncbi:MAG TPA: hypothetical protein PLT08_14165 [Anaerolineales bacterium]|nr:hypothetical protein [Anaerolineales bacterium]
MQQVDYLHGMIRSEAIAYIQSLPGLTRDEFFDLMRSAEKKPVSRHHSADTKETIELRIQYLVNFIKKCGDSGATISQIFDNLKYNGSNMRYAIAEAIERGLIYVVRDGKKKVYKPAIGRKQ